MGDRVISHQCWTAPSTQEAGQARGRTNIPSSADPEGPPPVLPVFSSSLLDLHGLQKYRLTIQLEPIRIREPKVQYTKVSDASATSHRVFIPVSQTTQQTPVPPKAQISPDQAIGPELRHRAFVALRQQPPSAKLSLPSFVRIGARDSSAAPEWQRALGGVTAWLRRASCGRRQVIFVQVELDIPSP